MMAASSFPAVSRIRPSEPVLGDRRAFPAAAATSLPQTTPGAAGSGTTVKLSVRLPMTLAAFNTSVQQTFKEVMAVAAGLTRGDSGRVTLVVRDGGRRLLASSVGVDVTISMPDAASATRAVAALTADRINTGLAAAGLPAATITSAPAVSTPGLSAAAAAGRHALAWAALAAAAAVYAVA
jgi:hypothetical protein